jgi:transglutaminase-like putative cysteine protease
VQLTAEIMALAASLANNPVKIYNWVHDNIEFLPTYGSIQGSLMTLQTKRGNTFDTASLLIALLRAANIPARYGYGTVQIPIARVMNWVGGVTVPEAALQMLGQGGIPNIGLVQGGAITAVKLEHVWVEAWVDFEPSRGAVHREGDTWVPLDAAFKQYQYTAGMDLQGQISFDAQAFVNQVTASAQVNGVEGWVDGLDHSVIQNILTTYQVQIDTYVTTQKPNATVGDVLGTKTIVPARRPVLAMGLPYMVVVRGNVWTQIPDTLRHQFRFHLYATALDQILDAPILSLTQSLPTLAGKKLTFVLCTSESGRCGSSDELSAATPYQWGPTGPPHVSNLAAWVSHPTGRRTPGRGPGCRQRRTVHHGAGVGEYTGIV